MEEKRIEEERRVTPVEKNNIGFLSLIFVTISAAIILVMVSEYSKLYDLGEVLTENFVTLLITILSIVAAAAMSLFFAGRKLFRVLEVNSDYEVEIVEMPSQSPPSMINFLFYCLSL